MIFHFFSVVLSVWVTVSYRGITVLLFRASVIRLPLRLWMQGFVAFPQGPFEVQAEEVVVEVLLMVMLEIGVMVVELCLRKPQEGRRRKLKILLMVREAGAV